MNILGISAYYHDSAATLIKDGKIIAAAQEERFTRVKNDPVFPTNAVAYCLKTGGITTHNLDWVAFYDKPLTKFERLLESYLARAPKGIRSFLTSMPVWLKDKLFIRDCIAKELGIDPKKILFTEHHESHAASAFYPSPFNEAAVLTMDGVGEWTTTSYGVGSGNSLKIIAEQKFPHSLGLLYSAFTYYLGFKINDGEYKVMGLAPYGEPRYVDKILSELIDLKPDGSLKINQRYFNYVAGLTMTNKNFHTLFGGLPLPRGSKITQREMDIARSLQVVTEEVMLRLAKFVYNQTGQKNICLAGGVALNSVGNGRLLKEGPFEHIWIQPAAGDAGGSLGAALFVWHNYLNNPRQADDKNDSMQGAYLGPEFSDEEIKKYLEQENIAFTELAADKVAETAADLIANEKVVGWFQGRMEFGPRALGNRSILGDARSQKMQSVLNLKIKFRESFRPFAPAVLAERANEYFDINCNSPYMLFVVPVQAKHCRQMTDEEKKLFGIAKLNVARSDIPAVTHVDYSARLQTVHKDKNEKFYNLIAAFEKKYGCAVIINTSFNVNNEPIVCAPQEAYRCFKNTQMDCLIMGNFLISKKL